MGIKGEFPLWNEDTTDLIHEFIHSGLRSLIVSAADAHFDRDFLGTEIDTDFLTQLPQGVDPCGENGEFHSFCYAGPIFEKEIPFEKGISVVKYYDSPNRDSDGKEDKKESKELDDGLSHLSSEALAKEKRPSASKTAFHYLDLLPQS